MQNESLWSKQGGQDMDAAVPVSLDTLHFRRSHFLHHYRSFILCLQAWWWGFFCVNFLRGNVVFQHELELESPSMKNHFPPNAFDEGFSWRPTQWRCGKYSIVATPILSCSGHIHLSHYFYFSHILGVSSLGVTQPFWLSDIHLELTLLDEWMFNEWTDECFIGDDTELI